VGSDGTLYVADVVNGRVYTYHASGGRPVSSAQDEMDGMNNPIGVTMGDGGMIYTAEPLYVRQFDRDGRFVRRYAFDCHGNYMAIHQQWLDFGCDNRFLAINMKDGYLQRARQHSGDAPINSPTGLAYGVGSTLYALESDAIVAYTVHH
jgi:hypothetical protein